ncbi:hypothetical protein C8J57DRAFT_111301 [Mycena rebaudengoi]|nr:hypothetical protein C8J57DRAFT_111301 [Mycena rebaudengoi]
MPRPPIYRRRRLNKILVYVALVIYPFIIQFVRDTGVTGGDESQTGHFAGLIVRALWPRGARIDS